MAAVRTQKGIHPQLAGRAQQQVVSAHGDCPALEVIAKSRTWVNPERIDPIRVLAVENIDGIGEGGDHGQPVSFKLHKGAEESRTRVRAGDARGTSEDR